MNLDRNTVIGFILLAALFIGFFYFTSKDSIKAQHDAFVKDSIANANRPKTPVQKPGTDTAQPLPATGADFPTAGGVAQMQTLENELMKVTFTSNGGQPALVELKKFKGTDSLPAKLGGTPEDKIDYRISTGNNQANWISEMNFQPTLAKTADGSQVISYTLAGNGKQIVHEYILHPNNYNIDFNIKMNGAGQMIGTDTLALNWTSKPMPLQQSVKYERQQSTVSFMEDGDYDWEGIHGSDQVEMDKPVSWIAVKQQFFAVALQAKNKFANGRAAWQAPTEDTTRFLGHVQAVVRQPLNKANDVVVPMALYYGPTDYQILKKYDNGMFNLVNLGSGIFSFVKYINRWIIVPIFGWLSSFTPNFGIAILLLTLFIRLVISPLNYKSYVSSAKMKVLRPELEQLTAKYGDDQQQKSMAQMKLYGEAGVSPLGGCLPALLQIPIFFALYSFFNSNVALRGQDFLWAHDLSQPDVILHFGHIPVISTIYGDHVSLFTITAVLTSFLISLYSMSMTPDQSNPMMKYMPYIFPVILLFVFNNLPAGLTWYYTVSNIITLVLQFVIQNYIIDHKKILAQIEANRKKPKKQNKLQARIQEMQEQQQKMKEAQKGRR